MQRTFAVAALGLGLLIARAQAQTLAQDMMRDIDLSSPDMVAAEMTRAEVEATLSAATVCRTRGFHRQEAVWPQPLRTRPDRRDLSRRAG